MAPPGLGAPAWAQGVAYLRHGVVSVAWRDRQENLANAEQTFVHELAHVALHDATEPHHVPRWLHEGFAYLHAPEVSFPRMWSLGSAVLGGNLIPLSELDARFPTEENQVHLAYVQANDFVAFLARRGRWEDAGDDGDRHAFRQFLLRVSEGVPVDDAAFDAYGRTLPQLEEEWRSDLQGRYLWLPVGVAASAIWVIASFLLVLAWLRRSAQKRRRLAEMARQEAAWDDLQAADR